VGVSLLGWSSVAATDVARPASIERKAMIGTGTLEQAESRGRLADLYLSYSDGALRLAYLLTGDRSLAEDLVQDAFVKLAGRFADLRDPGAFEAYLRKTVVNLARMHFRRTRLERAYLQRQNREPGPNATLPDVAAYEEMKRALLSLPHRQRAALVLRYYEDLSEAQIAEVLRCRPGTVKSLLSRGVRGLRAHIGGD
jgi:RNA polymerase sigma-70 factor (sigma-E family)